MKKNLLKLFICSLFFQTYTSLGQYEIKFPSWYKGPFNKLYVKIDDLNDSYSKEIIKIIDENWKICPISYYTEKNIDSSLLIDGNLFLNVERYSIDSQNVRQSENFGTSYGAVVSKDYYYLNFWVIDEKYNPKNDLNDYKFSVARAELYLKTIGMGPEDLKKFEFKLQNRKMNSETIKRRQSSYDLTSEEFEFYYCNGMPGNIKNIIQHVNKQILDKKEKKLLDSIKPTAEISKLKTEVLYVPNYWYGPGGTMLDILPENDKIYKLNVKYIDDLLKSYPFEIKLITRPELNEMVMNASNDFYYLNYIQSSTDKIISVVNGKNGDVIYSENTSLSYRLKNKDFENVGKAVSK